MKTFQLFNGSEADFEGVVWSSGEVAVIRLGDDNPELEIGYFRDEYAMETEATRLGLTVSWLPEVTDHTKEQVDGKFFFGPDYEEQHAEPVEEKWAIHPLDVDEDGYVTMHDGQRVKVEKREDRVPRRVPPHIRRHVELTEEREDTKEELLRLYAAAQEEAEQRRQAEKNLVDRIEQQRNSDAAVDWYFEALKENGVGDRVAQIRRRETRRAEWAHRLRWLRGGHS